MKRNERKEVGMVPVTAAAMSMGPSCQWDQRLPTCRWHLRLPNAKHLEVHFEYAYMMHKSVKGMSKQAK